MSKKNKNQFKDTINDTYGIYDGCAIFIGAYIVMLILQMLMSVVLSATKVDQSFRDSAAYVCITVALNQLAFFSAPFIYGKIKSKRVWTDSGYKKAPDVVQIALSIGIAVATLCAFAPISTLFGSLISYLGFTSDGAMSAHNALELVLYCVFSALLPALCEEFLFRGHVARGYKSGGYIFGVFVSAALFSLMHGSPMQLVYQFFMGVVTCLLFYFSRSIWTGFTVHFLSNLIVLIADYIMTAKGVDAVSLTPTLGIIFAVMTVVGVPALVGFMYLFILRSAKKAGKTDALKEIKGLGAKSWERRLALLNLTDEEIAKREEKQAEINLNIEQAATPEIKEMYLTKIEEDAKRQKRINRRALIVTFAIVLVMWIVNTILGFVE